MRGYVARDRSGIAYFYLIKPRKWQNSRWCCHTREFQYLNDKILPPNINPQWEDDEPIEVEISINRVKK